MNEFLRDAWALGANAIVVAVFLVGSAVPGNAASRTGQSLRILDPAPASQTVSKLSTGVAVAWLYADEPYSRLKTHRLVIQTDEHGQRSARPPKARGSKEPIVGLVGWRRRDGRVPTALFNRGEVAADASVLFRRVEYAIEVREAPHDQDGCTGCSETHQAVILKAKDREQILMRKVNTAYLHVNWAGDLDGDGHLDLLLSTGFAHGGTVILFLSKASAAGAFVREVARDEYECGC